MNLSPYFVTSRSAIPAVAAQPTVTGRRMRIGPVLSDGSVLVGYGDQTENTGPIDVLSVSPTGVVITRISGMDTEETSVLRLLSDGWAYVPALDPKTNVDAQIVTNAPAGTWRTIVAHIDGSNPIHLDDVTRDGTTLLGCGSRVGDPVQGTAMVWASSDGGATWAEELTGPAGRFPGFTRTNGRPVVRLGDVTYQRSTTGTWTAGGPLVADLPASPFVTVTARRVTSSQRASFVLGPGTWTGSLGPDGSIWLCDGTSIYRMPPAA